jgi:hypothetical protein
MIPKKPKSKLNSTKQNTYENRSGAAIFTVCSVNYLTKAVALALSAKEFESECEFYIVLSDSRRQLIVDVDNVNILYAQDLQIKDFLKRAFKYNIIEFNTSIKPEIALQLLDRHDRVIYLDPDVLIFSRLESVFDGLLEYSILLTPHALSPYYGTGRPDDLDLLRFGAYNLGFFAVKCSDISKKMLKWWNKECLNRCFYEPHAGMGVDQKWFDLVPSFFDEVCIIRKPALNVAFWNLHERELTKSGDSWFVNGNTPLEFFHFSSFVDSANGAIAQKQTRYASGSRSDYLEVATVYRGYLSRSKERIQVSDASYSFDRFDNGDTISAALRRFYSISEQSNFFADQNPFCSTGSVHKFAKKHGLLSKREVVIKYGNLDVTNKYSMQRNMISYCFRFILMLLGPDRYFSLMRYLAHYSSILNQGDLLKK